MDDLRVLLKEILRRIEALERVGELTNITIPQDGKIVVDTHSSDPEAINGRIYYNSTTNKFKVCENGVWKTVTTS